ncbi:MAG: hypothetical protein RL885_12655 [Planctomycetota bacterium]
MSRHATIPAERCYWAVVDPSSLPRASRRDANAVAYLAEPLLPLPLEELHLVTASLDPRHTIVCAVERTWLESRADDCIHLCPEALPEVLGLDLDPARLNLLSGEYTPRPIRQWRQRSFGLALLAVLLLAGTVIWGLERRRSQWLDQADAVRVEIRDVQRRALGPAALSGRLPAELQMTAELRRLRQSREVETAAAPEVRDVSMDLGDLLGHWPRQQPLLTESIHVTQDTIHINAGVTNALEAQDVYDALAELAGWQSHQPSVRSMQGGFRATLRLDRENAEDVR